MEQLPSQILEHELSISVHDQLNLAKTCKSLYTKIKPAIVSKIKFRLAHLFSPSNDSLIDYLSQNGIIAGGSIVYALNRFVPIESVSDIDIYINDKTRFLNTINSIYHRYSGTTLTTTNPSDYFGSGISQNKISIINLTLDQQRVNLQFIYHNYKSAHDILKYYDYDYVQCALENNNLIISKDCRESHQQRKVIKGYHLSNATRLRKATLKGFAAPIFGFTKNVQTIPLALHLTEDDLEYFKPTMPLGAHNINDALVVALEQQNTAIQLPNNNRWNQVYPVLSQIAIKGQMIKSMYISLEINVEQFIPAAMHGSENEVKITPLKLGQNTIRYCKIKDNIIDLYPGKQSVIARFRGSSFYHERPKLSLKIVDLVSKNYSGLNYDKIVPLNLSPNFTLNF